MDPHHDGKHIPRLSRRCLFVVHRDYNTSSRVEDSLMYIPRLGGNSRGDYDEFN